LIGLQNPYQFLSGSKSLKILLVDKNIDEQEFRFNSVDLKPLIASCSICSLIQASPEQMPY
jgi:hypothetical protein